tara:strand:- start:793 stop:1131 length:339 start_codon:yes stop_codon:yes gene_type:complete
MVRGDATPSKMKLRLGRVRWNSFWCGEKRTFFCFGFLINFNSTMKNPHRSWYPRQSHTPKDDQLSSLVHLICGVFFFNNFQRSDSFFTRTLCILKGKKLKGNNPQTFKFEGY